MTKASRILRCDPQQAGVQLVVVVLFCALSCISRTLAQGYAPFRPPRTLSQPPSIGEKHVHAYKNAKEQLEQRYSEAKRTSHDLLCADPVYVGYDDNSLFALLICLCMCEPVHVCVQCFTLGSRTPRHRHMLRFLCTQHHCPASSCRDALHHQQY